MTSSPHGLYAQGHTRATMALHKATLNCEVMEIAKITPQFRLEAATRLHEVGIASNRGSATPR